MSSKAVACAYAAHDPHRPRNRTALEAGATFDEFTSPEENGDDDVSALAEMICENTSPTLTSIQPDFKGGGYLAPHS